MTNNNTQWRLIDGYSGKYSVSACGKVFNNDKNRELILSKSSNGYTRVTLIKDKKTKVFSVHRLVALAFLNPDKYRKDVNHKNGIKTDNRIENLEWCNKQENTIHAISNKLIKRRFSHEQIKEMELLYREKHKGKAEIARMYNTSEVMIMSILRNTAYTDVPRKYPAETRVEIREYKDAKRRFTVYLEKSLAKDVSMYATETEISFSEFIGKAALDYLSRVRKQ